LTLVGPYLEDVLIQLGINAVLALSLYFPLSAGQLSLGQAGFMAIGAYASSWLTVTVSCPWPIAFAVAILAAGCVGALVGLPALRVRGIYLVLMTMAFGEIVRVFFLNFEPTGGAEGLRGMPLVTTLPLVAGIVVVLTILAARTAGSRMGRAFEAVKRQELAAEVIGVDVTRVKLLSFTVGAAVAGLAGALLAHYIPYIQPEEFGFHRSVMPFTFMVVGGVETYWGAIVGAAALTALPEWLRFLREWRLVFYGLAMIAVMIVRPQGLVDRRLLHAITGGLALRFRSLAIAVALALVALPAASADAAAKLAGKTVRLTGIFPMTGSQAEWGQHSKIATEIALEEINGAGGIGGLPVEVNIQDTATDPAQAITLARKAALEDKTLAILGPCESTAFEAIAPLLERLKIMMVSQCSAKPGLAKLSQWAFRNTLTSDRQLEPAVAIWKKRYNVKTVAIVYDQGDAVAAAEGSKVLPALFKKHGIEVKELLTYQAKDIDFSAQVTKVKSLGVDGVGLGSCYQQAANIVREARKQGLRQPFIAGACTGSPEFAKLTGKGGEGTIIASAGWPDDPRPKVQTFIKKFVERSGGKKPNYGGMRTYDNVYIMKHVIETTGVTNKPEDLEADRDRMRKGWNQIKDWDGIAGLTTLLEREGAGKPTVLTVKDNALVKIDY
jgi:ABC-type branched-subunit amino acid transport system permease subunit/ABC-type branched-subunit amino acid transport system substrate-binding protein